MTDSDRKRLARERFTTPIELRPAGETTAGQEATRRWTLGRDPTDAIRLGIVPPYTKRYWRERGMEVIPDWIPEK